MTYVHAGVLGTRSSHDADKSLPFVGDPPILEDTEAVYDPIDRNDETGRPYCYDNDNINDDDNETVKDENKDKHDASASASTNDNDNDDGAVANDEPDDNGITHGNTIETATPRFPSDMTIYENEFP